MSLSGPEASDADPRPARRPARLEAQEARGRHAGDEREDRQRAAETRVGLVRPQAAEDRVRVELVREREVQEVVARVTVGQHRLSNESGVGLVLEFPGEELVFSQLGFELETVLKFRDFFFLRLNLFEKVFLKLRHPLI